LAIGRVLGFSVNSCAIERLMDKNPKTNIKKQLNITFSFSRIFRDPVLAGKFLVLIVFSPHHFP